MKTWTVGRNLSRKALKTAQLPCIAASDHMLIQVDLINPLWPQLELQLSHLYMFVCLLSCRFVYFHVSLSASNCSASYGFVVKVLNLQFIYSIVCVLIGKVFAPCSCLHCFDWITINCFWCIMMNIQIWFLWKYRLVWYEVWVRQWPLLSVHRVGSTANQSDAPEDLGTDNWRQRGPAYALVWRRSTRVSQQEEETGSAGAIYMHWVLVWEREFLIETYIVSFGRCEPRCVIP